VTPAGWTWIAGYPIALVVMLVVFERARKADAHDGIAGAAEAYGRPVLDAIIVSLLWPFLLVCAAAVGLVMCVSQLTRRLPG
jgi:predicted membrane-bound spermidine synthase